MSRHQNTIGQEVAQAMHQIVSSPEYSQRIFRFAKKNCCDCKSCGKSCACQTCYSDCAPCKSNKVAKASEETCCECLGQCHQDCKCQKNCDQKCSCHHEHTTDSDCNSCGDGMMTISSMIETLNKISASQDHLGFEKMATRTLKLAVELLPYLDEKYKEDDKDLPLEDLEDPQEDKTLTDQWLVNKLSQKPKEDPEEISKFLDSAHTNPEDEEYQPQTVFEGNKKPMVTLDSPDEDLSFEEDPLEDEEALSSDWRPGKVPPADLEQQLLSHHGLEDPKYNDFKDL